MFTITIRSVLWNTILRAFPFKFIWSHRTFNLNYRIDTFELSNLTYFLTLSLNWKVISLIFNRCYPFIIYNNHCLLLYKFDISVEDFSFGVNKFIGHQKNFFGVWRCSLINWLVNFERLIFDLWCKDFLLTFLYFIEAPLSILKHTQRKSGENGSGIGDQNE